MDPKLSIKGSGYTKFQNRFTLVDTLFCGDEKGRCYATTCVLGGAMCREMLSELEELHWVSNSPKEDRINIVTSKHGEAYGNDAEAFSNVIGHFSATMKEEV